MKKKNAVPFKQHWNSKQTIYTYVTVVLDELFAEIAEVPVAISLLIIPYLQFRRFLTFEHDAFFAQTFAHLSWESDFRRF